MRYRKKPVVVEAMQFTGYNAREVQDWIGDSASLFSDSKGAWDTVVIHTLEGDMTASREDWIIQGVHGEFYPCKPGIFAATYEPET